MKRVIALSKRQLRTLAKGTLTIYRGGQAYILTHKHAHSAVAARIMNRIEELKAKLSKLTEVKKHKCAQAQCDKVFDSKRGANLHHKRMHVRNWSGKPKKS